jgi:hypothetical protein
MKLITVVLCTISLMTFGQIKDSKDDGRKIRVPVVFHIIYSKDSEDINDSLIYNELTDLNLDFSAKNDVSKVDEDFKNIISNADIEYYLLDTLLQPKGLKGVRRIAKSGSLTLQNYLISPKFCLNVFIADQGNASDILSDRVNLNYSDVGLHNHVMTHETGHWLGLYHIWGKIGSCSSVKVIFGSHDDEIDDTPTQWKCSDLSYSNICPPNRAPYYKGKKVMYNNFMDYSGCRCMFTIKQVIRMRNNIIENKNDLFLQANK